MANELAQVLSDVMETERPGLEPSQIQEMTLAIASMKFRYLHILLILTKDAPAYGDLRLTSARQALEILPQMASRTNSVYGVIW